MIHFTGVSLLSGNQSWKNWLIIFILLIVFAIVTAVWTGLINNAPVPAVGGGSSLDTSAIPVETENIDFEIKPIPVTQPFPAIFGFQPPTIEFTILPNGIKIEEINPLVAIGALFGLIIGGIVVAGGAIAAPIMLFSRTVDNVKESETFKESDTRLANAEKALKKEMNEGRSIRKEDHVRPRWSAISTSLIILMFAWFVALVLNGTFFPEGFTFLGGDPDRYLRTTPLFVWATLAVTALALFAWMRPKSLQAATEKADSAEGGAPAIPWDTIAVIMTGLVIVGLGIGAMAYLLSLGS